MKLIALTLLLSFQAMALTTTQREDVDEFVENMKPIENLFEMNKYDIKNVMLSPDKAPWSGSFWPDRAGSIAVSYTDSKFIERMKILFGSSFAERSFNRQQREIESEIAEMSEEDLNKLSPAEKYDLLMGDTSFSLSKQIWKRINHIKGYSDGLAFWSGICHGWAPASIAMPRPNRGVRLPILGGRKTITFYPDDLKALGSYLWASKANFDDNMKFAGNRCNIKKPKIDRKTDLVKPLKNPTRQENECGDTDPVSFHIIAVNRLGIQKKSFIADIDYNAVVNNHPIAGYRLTYFNPVTTKAGSMRKSLFKISNLFRDPLKDNRNKDAKYVIGVEMKMIFADWKIPRKDKADEFEKDGHISRKFIYQLEVDARGNIVGGHWRMRRKNSNIKNNRTKPAVAIRQRKQFSFPDFIWAHSDNFSPKEYFTYVSKNLELDLEKGVTPEWTKASIKNAENTLLLLNSSRIRHSLSKDEDLDKKAKALAKKLGISEESAADKFEKFMDKLGVPKTKENPQILSKVIYKLFDLAR